LYKKIYAAVFIYILVASSFCSASIGKVKNIFTQGEEAFQQHNYSLAAKKFAKAVKLDPENLRTRFRYGQVLFSLTNYSDSLKQFQNILLKSPNNISMSSGLGVPAKAETAINSIAENVLHVRKNKKWYRIPNGSWYRTWVKAEHNDDCYLIYYDEWREQPLQIAESFWRGEFPGKAVEREVMKLDSKSLFRIAVNENLQINPQFPAEFKAASSKERLSSFFKPGKGYDKGKLLLYSWKKNEPGKLEVPGNDDNFSKAFESNSSSKRFAAIGHKKVFVIGSDILKKWLFEAGINNAETECTLACFKNVSDGKSVLIAVYSEPDSILFKFRYNEELNVLDPNVTSLKLDLKPDAICFDENANLLIAAVEKDEVKFFKNVQPGYEVETTYFNAEEPLGKFSEGIFLKPWMVVSSFPRDIMKISI